MTTLLKKHKLGWGAPYTDLFNLPLFGEDFKIESAVPAVNIREEKDGYTIEFAAPGLKKEDFKIELKDGLLTVSSEKKEENEETDKNYTRKEFSYSAFSRSFRLPDHIAAEHIKATYKDGVLILNLPKLADKPDNKKVIEVG